MSEDKNRFADGIATGEQVSAGLEETLARQRAFWQRLATDRPLLRVVPWQDWQPYAPFVLRDGSAPTETYEITPGLLDPVASLQATRPSRLVDGDFICGWSAYDQCWTEAILGCGVKRAGPSVWSEPLVTSWDDVDRLPPSGSEEWLDELVKVNQVLIEEVQGIYPVSQPLMRGPLDMAEAALPAAMLYAGFYEEPDRLRGFLQHCARLFIEAASRRLAGTPRFPWWLRRALRMGALGSRHDGAVPGRRLTESVRAHLSPVFWRPSTGRSPMHSSTPSSTRIRGRITSCRCSSTNPS